MIEATGANCPNCRRLLCRSLRAGAWRCNAGRALLGVDECRLRGDVNSIRVGANSNVQDCAVLHGQRNLYPVIVGDWVTIGHNATVHAAWWRTPC